MSMTGSKTFWLGIITFAVFASGGVYFISKSRPTNTVQSEKLATTTTTTSTDNIDAQFYALSPEERSQALANMVFAGEYRAVVNATQFGIDNYRDLVWDDIDFWIHRGMAFFQLGNCPDSSAAFYHVLTRDPEDEIALSMMSKIGEEKCKTPLLFLKDETAS